MILNILSMTIYYNSAVAWGAAGGGGGRAPPIIWQTPKKIYVCRSVGRGRGGPGPPPIILTLLRHCISMIVSLSKADHLHDPEHPEQIHSWFEQVSTPSLVLKCSVNSCAISFKIDSTNIFSCLLIDRGLIFI